MNNRIPGNAMVQSECSGRACFVISETLLVSMCNGEGTTLSVQLTPEETRNFGTVFLELADAAEEVGRLGAVECAGQA